MFFQLVLHLIGNAGHHRFIPFCGAGHDPVKAPLFGQVFIPVAGGVKTGITPIAGRIGILVIDGTPDLNDVFTVLNANGDLPPFLYAKGDIAALPHGKNFVLGPVTAQQFQLEIVLLLVIVAGGQAGRFPLVFRMEFPFDVSSEVAFHLFNPFDAFQDHQSVLINRGVGPQDDHGWRGALP